MAWTAPRTWTVGEIVTAAMMNAHVRDDMRWASGDRGTTLPGSPNDGDEYYYIADATNGVIWRFKYRTASLKWEFIGGPPLFQEIAATEATASTAYGNLGTIGPSVTVPLAGDYLVSIGMRVPGDNSGNYSLMSYDIGGTGASDNDACSNTRHHLGQLNAERTRPKTGLAAGTALVAKYRQSAAVNNTIGDRIMTVLPIRVG